TTISPKKNGPTSIYRSKAVWPSIVLLLIFRRGSIGRLFDRAAARRCHFLINLCTAPFELLGFFLHADFQCRLLLNAFLRCVVADVLGNFHRAEVWATHRAEVSHFSPLRRQGLIVKLARRVGIQAQVELILPAKFEAGAA